MTQETLYDNCILGYGGVNAFTIYTIEVKETGQKQLKVIPGVKSKNNRDGNLPTTRALDLLRQELRFTITGHIDSADRSKFRNLYAAGGPCTLRWDSTSYTANIEKYDLTRGKNVNDEWDFIVTLIIGNDL